MKPISNTLEFAFALDLIGKPKQESEKIHIAIFIYYLLKRGLIAKDFVCNEEGKLNVLRALEISLILSEINGEHFFEFVRNTKFPKKEEIEKFLFNKINERTYKELIKGFTFEQEDMLKEIFIIWMLIKNFYDKTY